jgi:hypothetical protein
MTPRDLDPAVWVAAYGAAWADFYRIAYTATDAPSEPERRSRALETTAAFTDRMTVIADAAVLALHPEPTVQVMGERVPRGSATDLRAEASKRERAGDFDGEGALLDRANVLDRLAALEAAARAVCDHACARPTSDPLSVPARLIAALHEALNDYARSRQQPTT